jgi:sugar lactone lactonase YvrE
MTLHQPTLFAQDFVFLEAPRWRDGRLWLSDVWDHKVYTMGTDGSRELVCEVPHRPSGLGFLPDGTPIVVSSKNRKLVRIEDACIVEYADLNGFATGDVNDLVVDFVGRVYIGNFGYDYDAGEPRALTCLHRVDPDGSVHIAATDVEFPNGMVIINGGRTLVVAETWLCRLIAFDIDEQGNLGNRTVYADLGERQPDGICVDSEGGIWVGCFNTGEFLRVLEGGKVTDVIAFEGHAVACTFGGPHKNQLYCTVYLGSIDELVAGKRKAAVYSVPVTVSG